jgi:hypothetical protein
LVRDASKVPPNDVVSGATIQLRYQNKAPFGLPVPSGPDGRYEIPNVPNGAYVVHAEAVTYSPPAQEKSVNVNGDTQVSDLWFAPKYMNQQDVMNHAQAIMVRVGAAPNRTEGLMREWNLLRDINFPPDSRARLAAELNKLDGNARAILPDLNAYLEVRPEQVGEAQSLFGRALAENVEPPARGRIELMGIRPEIAADVALFSVKGSSAPAATKRAFVDRFARQWNGTDARRRMTEIGGADLEKLMSTDY